MANTDFVRGADGTKLTLFEYDTDHRAVGEGLVRGTKTVTLTIADNQAITDAFDFRGYAGGIVIMPATWDAATLAVHVSSAIDGTFVQLFEDDATTRVQIGDGTNKPVVSKAYTLPAEMFTVPFAKLQSEDGSGNAVNQTTGTTRTLILVLKS